MKAAESRRDLPHDPISVEILRQPWKAGFGTVPKAVVLLIPQRRYRVDRRSPPRRPEAGGRGCYR
jgi:hypothetical protein